MARERIPYFNAIINEGIHEFLKPYIRLPQVSSGSCLIVVEATICGQPVGKLSILDVVEATKCHNQAKPL